MAFPNWIDHVSEAELDAQIERAIVQGEWENSTQIRAKSVHFDVKTNLITIALKNGCFFSFPPALIQQLAEASAEALNDLWLDASGSSVHWDSLDADLDIPQLILGVFGTQSWMAELGRKGGQNSSPANSIVTGKQIGRAHV